MQYRETNSSFECLHIGFRKPCCSFCCIKGFVYSPRGLCLGLGTLGDTCSDVASLSIDMKAKAAEIISGVYMLSCISLKPGGFHEGKTTYLASLNCLQWKENLPFIITGRNPEASRKAVLSERSQVDATVLNIISWQRLLPTAAASRRQNCFCCDASFLPALLIYL